MSWEVISSILVKLGIGYVIYCGAVFVCFGVPLTIYALMTREHEKEDLE